MAVDDPDGAAVQHLWDFGDGSGVTGPAGFTRFVHRYGDDGTYTVTHSVEVAGQAPTSRSFSLTIANAPPEVRRLEVPALALPRMAAEFAAPVFDPGNDVITYTWDFGDGSAPVQRRVDHTADHTFAEPGTYLVTVAADDGDGGTDSRSAEATVGEGFHLEVSGDLNDTNRRDRPPIVAGYPVERGPDGLLRFRGDLAGVVAGEIDVADGPGPCLVVLGYQSFTADASPGTALYLTAVLEGGLVPGSYEVARERNSAEIVARDPYELEFALVEAAQRLLHHGPLGVERLPEQEPTAGPVARHRRAHERSARIVRVRDRLEQVSVGVVRPLAVDASLVVERLDLEHDALDALEALRSLGTRLRARGGHEEEREQRDGHGRERSWARFENRHENLRCDRIHDVGSP